MNPDLLSLLMFGAVLVFLAIGYPVAFSLGGVALFFTFIGMALGIFDPILWSAMPQQIFGTMNNFTLLAIPYFIFLGSMLEKSGIAEDLLETMGILFGRVRGGLAVAVIIVGALLAATTGVVAATVIAMGLISLPTMLRYNYNKKLATGVIVASGTLGQIIPPSVVLVVLGDQLGVSVGDLFIGSVIPGLLMTGAFLIHVLIVAFLRPDIAPALPQEVLDQPGLGGKIIKVLIPPILLITLILGTIFFGIATPTEAGAVGCVGTMILAAANRRLNWENISQVCDATLRTTCMVMFILIGSRAFSLVFRGLGGEQLVRDSLSNTPGGAIGFLVITMLLIFILGFFIDFFEIVFIVVPLLVPIAQSFGMDLVWFGVVLGANIQTSFLTPPFGFALFYLRGVAPPEVTTEDIYQGAIPFILLQLMVLVLIIVFPQIVSFLPSLAAT
ncbi:TRAP transporter large permease subunit [Limnoraphis robusta]|uniref:TRAP transporter large permease subunit n=1 Tax=Limnoraphis robusta CCNP1315 TaxID=3110306 RepID=A0ABU5TYM5_9CYAN|nr:TRAP transporter large permease subunit [Limnoraphis robusta]MEA5520042.1 TRAP transporter large permease subunit [Limnoraphis robusta CCNP1315]MEA5548775.1 TRAP transporter large permease subunit [Limnoraphis robusta CCNP1324]